MSFSENLVIAFKAARQLGVEPVSQYAKYQLALRTGWLRSKTPTREPEISLSSQAYEINTGLINIPDRDRFAQLVGDQASAILAEANDINQGKVRLFGGPPQDFELLVPLPLRHWTTVTRDHGKIGVEDIKYLWEPARFTWIYPLVRAYLLSGNESYAETFWQEFEAFSDINILNMGPNWISGQEIAIRLISFTFAFQIFASSDSSTEQRVARLSRSIADHADRIPATFAYSLAQNNNHLLSEAAGLITAGNCLSTHPKANLWINYGRRWFNHALENQISASGTYIQQSTNYHRMMLQLALWVSALEDSITPENKERLAAATKWLLGLVDPDTGRVPNLGHNDGSYFQPLSSCAYSDFRPVIQAAAGVFLGEKPFPAGLWDEFYLWLGIPMQEFGELVTSIIHPEAIYVEEYSGSHLTIYDQTNSSWACFRVGQFNARPAHADQLHLDLWWRQQNITLDAGTFLYNADPPWDNPLIRTGMHNTVTINDKDQMTQAGRFLWLDWAQAEILDKSAEPGGKKFKVVAQHDGYRDLGVTHRRSITCKISEPWIVEDDLISSHSSDSTAGSNYNFSPKLVDPERLYHVRLHWLLPDWPWEIVENNEELLVEIKLRSPLGWITIQTGIESATGFNEGEQSPNIKIARAGELIHGSGIVSPVSGWVSPTYGYKVPALSYSIEIESGLPLRFTTLWRFPLDS